MKSTLRSVTAAAMLLVPMGAALVAQPAAAQYVQQQGRITNMSINSSAGVNPGATLRVQVYATPGAEWMSVALGDSGVRVRMREQARGEYVGSHVVRRGERIDPRQRMMVRAGWGEGPVTLSFNYPPSFQALAMGAGPATGNAVVESFAMTPAGRIEPGETLRFRLEGTPGARASVNIPDVIRALPLREVRPGVYVGRYTVRQGDDPRAFSDARAVLRSGNQRVSAQLDAGGRYGYGYGR
jgi:hypothetical protein